MPLYLPLLKFSIFHMALSYAYCYFISHYRTPLSLSFRARLVVMNSLSFCLSGKVLISSSFLKDSYARYRILGWVFSFSILNIWAHPLLASNISDEISAYNLHENPLNAMSTSLLLLSWFSLCLSKFDYNGSWYGSFEFILLVVHCAS